MLCPKGGFGKGSMDGIMRAALGSSAERNLKEQALLNLDEYLREEEIRTLIQMSDDANAREGAAAAAAAPAARYRARSGAGRLTRSARRRATPPGRRARASRRSTASTTTAWPTASRSGTGRSSWSCAPTPSRPFDSRRRTWRRFVLRQGLVHPMSCFPPLIALQADPVLTVRKLAMRLLRQQHGKYPDFFDHQLGAGLGLLFEFCKRLQAAARRAARRGARYRIRRPSLRFLASAAVVNQGFTNIYKLVNGTRSTRFKFLRALLRRYEANERVGRDVPVFPWPTRSPRFRFP